MGALLALAALAAGVQLVDAWDLPRAADIPVYFISLPRRNMNAEFDKLHKQFSHAETFDAVDGMTIDIAHDKRVSLFARGKIELSDRRSHVELNSRGALGAYLSHISVIAKFLAQSTNESDIALVVEDDANIPPDLSAIIQSVSREMPPPTTWDVWLLANGAVPKSTPSHLRSWPELPPTARLVDVQHFWGMQAYIVSVRGARRIVESAFPIAVQIDGHLSTMAALGDLTILWREDEPRGLHLRERLFVTTTIQLGARCDICELSASYSRWQDVLFWILVGGALAVGGPRAYKYVCARRLAATAASPRSN